MTTYEVLLRVDAEFRPLVFKGDFQAIGSEVIDWVETGLTVRVVRGRKMRTVGGLFDEFAAALQFPLYFGENMDAFDECIANLETLPLGKGYVVVFTEPDQTLADAPAEELQSLVNALDSANASWSQPVELGEWWDRPAVPFHVVLAGERDAIERAVRNWSATGVQLRALGQAAGAEQ